MVNTDTFQRMLEEFKGLSEKVDKLRNSIMDEEKMKEVDMLNKDLLIAQLKAMESYQSILSIRLGLNVPQKEDAEETNEDVSEL